MTSNQIAYHNAKETARHNKMTEDELHRHQVATELLQAQANALQERSIAVNEMHYARMDAETQRANRAREIENYRSDITGEAIKEAANAINAAAVSETSRHQRATEAITKSLNASIIGKNEAETSVASANAGYIQARTGTELFSQLEAQSRIATASVERELKRAQIKTQNSQQAVNYVNAGTSFVRGVTDVVKVLAPLAM